MTRFLFILCLGFIASLSFGCYPEKTVEGVVASVNGEPVFLHEIQSVLDSRLPAAGIPPRPSLDETRKAYANGLNTLIVHVLVRQELKARDMEVSPEEVEAAIQEIRDDYGEDGLEAFLGNASIRTDDWRSQMRDYLSLEKFRDEVLLPGINISLEEIRDYYHKHEKEFKIPDNLYVCFLAAEEAKAINDWCADMDHRIISPLMEVECLYVQEAEIPVHWQKDIRAGGQGKCLPPREENGEWHTLALLEKNRGRIINMAEAYALIENIIMEEKRQAAFDSWLEKKISQSRIEVAPELHNAFEIKESTEDKSQHTGNL